jgi:hypothetical protein
MSSDSIWINNFGIILSKPVDFFPTRTQSIEERLNSIVRLSLYISIMLSIYHSKIKYLSIFIFVLFLTYIIYTNQVNQNISTSELVVSVQPNTNFTSIEKLDGTINTNSVSPELKVTTCTKPTVDNPFMNFTMKDYMTFDSNGDIKNRAPACDINDPKIKKLSDASFDNNLYKDVSDVFGKINSQRNFYTTASTSIVNDQETFSNWLYKTPYTCKEDQDACINGNFEDLRSNRFIQYDPATNPVDTKRLQK